MAQNKKFLELTKAAKEKFNLILKKKGKTMMDVYLATGIDHNRINYLFESKFLAKLQTIFTYLDISFEDFFKDL